MEELQKRIGYFFHNSDLLCQALTHASLMKKKGLCPFERLEFLGDRVLGLAIAQWLYERHETEQEGSLSRRYSALVGQSGLVFVAQRLCLKDLLKCDQQKASPRFYEKILADTCEALLGAIFLDGGWVCAERCVRNLWEPLIVAQSQPPLHAKSVLQEWAQAAGKSIPTYHVITCQGASHTPYFTVQVHIEGLPVFQGDGSSKRKAEVAAAQNALDHIQGKENVS